MEIRQEATALSSVIADAIKVSINVQEEMQKLLKDTDN